MVDELPGTEKVGIDRQTGRGGRSLRQLGSRKGRTLVVIVIVLVAALSSVVILTQPKDTVKLVAILSEAGTYSHTDEIEASLRMAVDDLNRWGGIGGTRIELVVEKTAGGDEAIAETFAAAERDHHPLAYITSGCEFISVLGPLVEEARAPLIGMGSTPGLTDGLEMVYRFAVSIDMEATSAIRLFDQLNVASVGVLYSLSLHSCGIHDAIIDEADAAGVAHESESFATMDEVLDSISRLMDNQAIFCVGSCSELAVMLPAVHESGFTGHIMSASCASTPLLWNAVEGADVYVSAPLIYKPENINAREFMLRFEGEYDLPATHHGAAFHDLVRLVHGLLDGHELTRESLKAELDKGFILSGVLGVIRASAGTHDFEFGVYPAVISEGELRYL